MRAFNYVLRTIPALLEPLLDGGRVLTMRLRWRILGEMAVGGVTN